MDRCETFIVNSYHYNDVHYGDVQIIINIIYNCALRDNFKAKVHFRRANIGEQIFKIFNYEPYVEIIYKSNPLPYTFKTGYMLNLGKYKTANWCNLNFCRSSCILNPLKKFFTPPHKIVNFKKCDYKCFQLDGRSSNEFKPKLNDNDMNRMIDIFHEKESYAIGGTETNVYIKNMPTHFTNLEKQAKFILSSKSFFGVDSGMSHLAGTLNVDGDIVIQASDKFLSESVKLAYEFMYSNFRVYTRDFVEKKCSIKIL